MDNASYVQLRLFPRTTPDEERGLDVSFFYRPYLRVIGDYFDFFDVDEDRTAVIVGDVSGHGLSAAMILSAVNSIAYAMIRENKSIEETFKEINDFLLSNYRGMELITLFVGIYDRITREMIYINAGHNSPVVIKKNKKELRHIENRFKVLGADPDAEYFSSRYVFDRTDEIFLYTDGLVDLYDEESKERLNDVRLFAILLENIEESIDGKLIEIEKNIKKYGNVIKDDITIVGVRIF